MVKVFPGTPHEFYMDGYLHTNLTTAKELIKDDWDMVFIVDGGERKGKSVLAMQMAYYCDPTLTLDRVTFTPDEFRNAVLNAKQNQAIIYDEAYTGMSAREAMSKINKALITMMIEIGQRNLFIFIVLPCFMILEKYVALFRTRAVIHVESEGKQRGFFKFYNEDKKKALYITGKKMLSYSYPSPNFFGRFYKFYPLDEAAYKKKKLDSLKHSIKNDAKEGLRREVKDAMFMQLVALGDMTTHTLKAKILGMPLTSYLRKLKDYKESLKDLSNSEEVPSDLAL